MLILAILLSAATPYVPIYQAVPSLNVLKQPVPELRQIAWMAGTWRCRTRSFATGSAPAHEFAETTYVGTFVMRNRLTGARPWVQLEDVRQRDLSFITYDPMARHWAVVGMEWPISYGVLTGTMTGNRLVVTGTVTVFGRNYRLRTTYTKRSDDAFTIVNEEQRPNGTWLRDDEYDFVRRR